MASPTTFGNDTELETLKNDANTTKFYEAIVASTDCLTGIRDGKACDLKDFAAKYDDVVGSASSGYGYCYDPKYRAMGYCACVNSTAPNAECVFGPCTNGANAFMPSRMLSTMTDAKNNCPQEVNCQQIFQMGGTDNIASGVTQSQNCGGVVNNIITNIKSNPIIAVVVFIMIISIVMFISEESAKSKKSPKTLPPPQLVFPL